MVGLHEEKNISFIFRQITSFVNWLPVHVLTG